MTSHTKEQGFTAVELLITLFIAAIFLIAGFQLYAAVIKDGGSTRAQSIASNLAYVYARQYSSSAAKPCAASTAYSGTATASNLNNVTVVVAITCPYSSYPTTGTAAVPTLAQQSVSKVLATVTYGTTRQTISNAVYVTK